MAGIRAGLVCAETVERYVAVVALVEESRGLRVVGEHVGDEWGTAYANEALEDAANQPVVGLSFVVIGFPPYAYNTQKYRLILMQSAVLRRVANSIRQYRPDNRRHAVRDLPIRRSIRLSILRQSAAR